MPKLHAVAVRVAKRYHWDIPGQKMVAEAITSEYEPLAEFVREVAKSPYRDSDPLSLLETLQCRALRVLKEVVGEPGS